MVKDNKEKYVKNYYDSIINSKIKDYEYLRWFSNSYNYLLYNHTYNILFPLLKKFKFKNILELGAGSGTWTKLFFLSGKSEIKVLDIDISEEMINSHKKYFAYSKNVDYLNADFLALDLKKFKTKYDLFMSIRCIEYISDFNKLFFNISHLLNDKGTGIIITKKPPLIKTRKFHSINRGYEDLKRSANKAGLSIVDVRPVFYQFPVPVLRNSYILTFSLNFFFKLLFKKINFFNYFFLESYVVVFNKK